MASALIITLRETLEASLVIGIMLAFLHRTHNQRFTPIIWSAVVAGVMSSAGLAWIFQRISGGFTGRTEAIYEGTMMLAAAGLITWMVLWLAVHGKHMKQAIENKMAMQLAAGQLVSLFLLAYTSLLREGIETVIFLQAAVIQVGNMSVGIGAGAGIILAVGLAFVLFKGMVRWNRLGQVFQWSALLLMLFAASLVATGLRELFEGLPYSILKLVPIWATMLYLIGTSFAWSKLYMNYPRFGKTLRRA